MEVEILEEYLQRYLHDAARGLEEVVPFHALHRLSLQHSLLHHGPSDMCG